jgi:hypothetical protein
MQNRIVDRTSLPGLKKGAQTMLTNSPKRRILLCLFIATLTAPLSLLALTPSEPGGQAGPSGELTVVGEVTVNGANAISGATVFSDSTVTTAKGSSAVVSLGKLGRVELLPESSMKLSFDGSSIGVAMLEAGRVRISSSSGTSAMANTKDGKVVADKKQANEFTVDTRCGNTLVSTQSGTVELRGRVLTRVPAGSDVEVGKPKPGCTR